MNLITPAYDYKQLPEVLIIEQVPFFRHQMKLQFESHGFSVIEAISWSEAEQLLTQSHPRLKAIISDLLLLRQDSFATLRRLRRQSGMKGIQIAVARLGSADNGNGLEAEGVSMILQKLENQQLPEWLASLESGNYKSVSGE